MILTAEQYCLRVTDGTHETPKTQLEGYPLITSKNILNGKLDMSDVKLISKEDYISVSKRSKVDQWDILFSMIGTVGEVYLHREENAEFAIKNLGLFKMGGERIKALKLYYFLKSDYFQRMIKVRMSGSIQSFLPLGFLRNIQIPDMRTIDASWIDRIEKTQEKINVNKRLIKNLEEYSQLLFHKWFVDYNFLDQNCNPYKNTGGEMVEVDGKIIPKGWKIDSISCLGEIVGGGTPSTTIEEYYTTETEISWITPKDLSINKAMYIYRGERDITGLGLINSSAMLMPKGTVLMSSRAPVGYLAIAQNPVTTNQGFKSVVPKKEGFSEFIYYSLKYKKRKIDLMSSGSTFSEISKETFKKLKITIPSEELILKYDDTLGSIFKQIQLAEKEIESLNEFRDLQIRKFFK